VAPDDLFRPVQRQRTYEQVLSQIEEQILQGRLRAGDRLPGERQLAESLRVSRPAVREALRVLEAMGIVSAGTGSGPGSGSRVTGDGSPVLSTVLRLHVALSSFSQREVMEVRVQLERWAVREAARSLRPEQVQSLREVVARMRDQHITHSAFNELDTDFHVGMAQACGNALLGLLMQALRDAVHQEMTLTFQRLSDPRSTRDALVSQHAAILDAVEGSDGEEAARLVERHIVEFYESLESSRLEPGQPT